MFQVTEGISDMNVGDSGNSHNRADIGFLHFHFVQSVKFIQFTDLYLFLFRRIVMVHQHHFLVHGNFTVVHFSNTDASHIFVIINGADQHLSTGVRITFRSGNVFQDGFKKRFHAFRCIIQIQHRMPGFGRGIQERTVQLFIGSIQIHQKFQHLIHHLGGTCLRAVDFVQTYNHMKIKFQRFFQHESGLGHSTFKSIYHQNHAVHHFQHPFHLAAEIGMPRGINDVDFCSFIIYCRIFGQDSNATLPLDVVGVHYPLLNFLVFPEYAALAQQLIHQGGFAVVYVGDDRHISDIVSFDSHKQDSFPWTPAKGRPADSMT